SGGSSRDFIVPFSKVPEVGLELARLTRDVKIQETLVTLLTQQVEQARLVEAKDVPVVQVLDRAVPAERPVRPRIAVNVAVAGAGGLLVGVFLALCLDSLKRGAAPSRRATSRPMRRYVSSCEDPDSWCLASAPGAKCRLGLWWIPR